MGKAKPILAPEPILALCERLRHHAHKARRPVAVDLRLTIVYLRRFASLAIADEAASEHDPDRKRKLEEEAVELWRQPWSRGSTNAALTPLF